MYEDLSVTFFVSGYLAIMEMVKPGTETHHGKASEELDGGH